MTKSTKGKSNRMHVGDPFPRNQKRARSLPRLKYHKQLGKSLYYFGRSKQFWTFKYPFVWYNALYLSDVLSRFLFIKKSPLLKDCVDWIVDAQDEYGRFKPASIYMPYLGWDFGNKKQPSPWITFL